MLQNCNIYNIISKYSNFLTYGFMILKMMIMCCLHTPELKLTTCSLCSIHDPYSTLETPVTGYPKCVCLGKSLMVNFLSS